MRITLRGEGKENEVRAILKEAGAKLFDPDKWNYEYTRTLQPYLFHYLQGYITKAELSSVLIKHYDIENLQVTALMGIVDTYEKEWKEWAKNPNVWYLYYHKDIDDITKKVTIFPEESNDMPTEYTAEMPDQKTILQRSMLEEQKQASGSLADIKNMVERSKLFQE